MGNPFTGRQPLDESPMTDHPVTPTRDSNLVRLLDPLVRRAVGLADRLTVAKGAQAPREELGRPADEGVAQVRTLVARSDVERAA